MLRDDISYDLVRLAAPPHAGPRREEYGIADPRMDHVRWITRIRGRCLLLPLYQRDDSISLLGCIHRFSHDPTNFCGLNGVKKRPFLAEGPKRVTSSRSAESA